MICKGLSRSLKTLGENCCDEENVMLHSAHILSSQSHCGKAVYNFNEDPQRNIRRKQGNTIYATLRRQSEKLVSILRFC